MVIRIDIVAATTIPVSIPVTEIASGDAGCVVVVVRSAECLGAFGAQSEGADSSLYYRSLGAGVVE